MNWLTNFVRPKIQALVHPKKTDVPENLWDTCSKCEQMVFHKDFIRELYVCHHCNYHARLPAHKRFELLFDEGVYHRIEISPVLKDPIKFKDSKKYVDRLKEYQAKTQEDDVLFVAEGKIEKNPLVVAVFDFSFMGGSMGLSVGQGLVQAAQHAVSRRIPLLVIPASGGARMQEGILSLMQMPRTTVAVQMVREAKLPYWVLLTDPTMGGVAASFAMLGDITLAEPGAIVGFAGRRVIEETIRGKLPDDFQCAEYLFDHGMVDMVVPRKNLRATLGRLLSLVMHSRLSSSV